MAKSWEIKYFGQRILMEQGGSGIDGSVAGGINFCSTVGDLRILLCGLSKDSKDFEGTEG